MGDSMNTLAQKLTGQQNLEDCNVTELKRLVQRYPYFAPAQFLLLHKLRQAGQTDEADTQRRKAVLFYHDPVQFDYFISSGNFFDRLKHTESNGAGNEVNSIEEVQIQPGSAAAFEKETVRQETASVEEAYSDTGDGNETTPEPVEGTAESEDEPHPIKIGEAEETHLLPASNREDQESIAQTATDETETFEEPSVQQSEPLVDEKADESLRPEMAQPVPQPQLMNSGNSTPSQDLAFEPFHTVDYFASQGIKILPDEVPKDKLGKQLKSFTEWLKTMKRLPTAQAAETGESQAEKKVESLAGLSVTESEVVTEAMADVWLKQGNREKALDIYNKLSLRNPSKTAYFAAKIENLKTS